jgi:hypothetical protein
VHAGFTLITVLGSFFSFEDQDHYELAPARVTDALRQMVVFDHSLNVQIFDFDALVLIDQPSTLPKSSRQVDAALGACTPNGCGELATGRLAVD